ncbi:MAG: septum formation initiator family protein [candidate division Zixibacteria bacterium]|nr:septum formation initiator family protein [candidate division Zixibacteria bacterium]
MPRRSRKTRSFFAPLTDGLWQRMSDHNSRVRRRVIRVGFWVIGGLFLYSLMSGTYGIPRIARLELERRSLVEANRYLTVELIENDRLRQLLRSSPSYIEGIARTRYYMVRPNETIYRYRGQ